MAGLQNPDGGAGVGHDQATDFGADMTIDNLNAGWAG